MGADEWNVGIHIVRDDDLENFGIDLAEAIGRCSAGGPPTIAFSHTSNDSGGYNYCAIVMGDSDPNAKVTIHDHQQSTD
jgi:hypothetical protein